jgi:uncharacterized protein YecE (DUF72 family)
VGAFYPSGTTQREYLPYYCKAFNSVELVTTFHSIPSKTIVQSWFASTPSNFKFSLKTPHVITHDLGLKGTQGLMSAFLDALLPLQEKTGPILIQLSPSYSQDMYFILNEFLKSLPQAHRFAIEFRYPSWYNEKTTQLLSQNQMYWVTIDYPNLPRQIYLTTDFLYFCWIGVNGMYPYHSMRA